MNKTVHTLWFILLSSIAFCQSNRHFFWRSDFNDRGYLKMIKLRPISKDSLNRRTMIKYLNGSETTTKDANHIVFKKISHDTLYIRILNTYSLTQTHGSAGAMLYLAEITYNLTELKNIKYVNMDFEEGDHASPGTYSREYFADK